VTEVGYGGGMDGTGTDKVPTVNKDKGEVGCTLESEKKAEGRGRAPVCGVGWW